MPNQNRKSAAALAASATLLAGSALAPAIAAAAAPLSQTRGFTLGAPCRQIFHLFTAEGERLWAPGWNPEILSGSSERGSVFRTTHANGQNTIWIVTEYRPDLGRASYARIAQGSNMGLVDVHCEDTAHDSSRVTVTYTLTGLSPEGAAFVKHFLGEQHFTAYIEEWKQSIDKLLQSERSDSGRTR